MSTKFILHGGMLSRPSEHNDSFFKEVTKDLKDGDTVLFVGFARRDEVDRMRIYERDKGYILAQTDMNILVENAEYDTFESQVKNAKVIFVTGGDTPELQRDFQRYPELQQWLQGKVYVGSSAGALVTARYYHTCADDEIVKGLDWLPIRLMVHYGSEDFNATPERLEELKEYDESLELLAIPECEWAARIVN